MSALRSPIFGCGDDDLYTFKVEHGGRWDHQRRAPESLPPDHPVGDAMRALAEWHDARLLVVAQRAARPDRARAARARGRVRARPTARPLAARALRGRAGARVRRRRGRERARLPRLGRPPGQRGARVVETVLPETDDDAVRILTIHGAKGLEFPITIVSGMTTQGAGRSRRCAAACSPTTATPTRLRVSKPGHHRGIRALRAHRRADGLPREASAPLRGDDPRPRPPRGVGAPAGEGAGRRPHQVDPRRAGVARRRRAARVGGLHRLRRRRSRRSQPTPRSAPHAPSPPPWAEWVLARDHALREASAVPRVRSATAFAREAENARAANRPGSGQGAARPRAAAVEQGPVRHRARPRGARGAPDRRPRHRRRPRRHRRRAGRGRGHHRKGRRRCRARPCRARRRASVQEAVAHGFRREMYVATPVDGTTLEGYVDLVYRRPDGLVVVDYKTDAWSRRRRPRHQGGALPPPGRGLRGGARTGDGRDGRRVRVRVPRRPRGARANGQ